MASFLSYNEAKRVSKTPEEFGMGHLDSVAAAEAGNNGVTGATLILLLTLGIPGDTVTAVLLGALMMQGLTQGPELFKTQVDIVYTIMVGLIFVNVFMFLQGTYFAKAFANVVKVPTNFLIPILIILCVTGAYAVNIKIFDVKVVIVFGAIAYVLGKADFPVTPMLLAIILGPIAEVSMRRSLLLSEGSYSIFFNRPISLFFLILSVISIFISRINVIKQVAN